MPSKKAGGKSPAHHSWNVVELGGLYFWRCSCNASSSAGFKYHDHAEHDAKYGRHGA